MPASQAQRDPPWFDSANALQELPARLAQADTDANLERVARDLIVNGFAVLSQMIPHAICDVIIADFQRFVAAHPDYATAHTDNSGRQLRFVNLHLASDAAMQAGNDPRMMAVLDFLFGRRAGVYTSLFFEHGSQQPIHRDSPFFHTYPMNYFVGVWLALEDVHPDSGPLMYVPGGHRFAVDQHAIYDDVRRQNPDRDDQWILLRALDRYYGTIITRAAAMGEPKRVLLRKGDCGIWHPALPHGGSIAAQPRMTRKSIVFHCAPVDTQVYQYREFLTSDVEPPPRYGFRSYRGREYAIAGEPAFQVEVNTS